MRVPALIVVALLGMSLGQGVAEAEKVKTNQKTELLTRPGERAAVIVSVKSGTSMQLISKEGRWLKVRVKGRTGYVPRSKVDMADDGDIARNTRRRPFVDGRGKKRGFGGSAPDDRVGADATVDRGSRGDDEAEEEEEEEEEEAPKPKKAATKAKAPVKDEDEEDEEEDEEEAPPPKKVAKATTKPKPPVKEDEEDEEDEEEDDEEDAKPAAKGSDDEEEDEPKAKDEPVDDRRRVRVTGAKVKVYEDREEDEDAEVFVARPTDTLFAMREEGGWTEVQNAEGDSGWVQSDLLEDDGGGGASGKRRIDVRARVGAMVLQQGLRTRQSTNPSIPDNYNVGTRAVSIALGGGILVPKGKWLFGGEATYEYSTPLGGVPIDLDGNGGNPPVSTGMVVHNVNVRGMFGLDFKKKSGMALLGRLGYRYQGILIANVASETANPGRLPSEVVKGPTIGAALAIPMLTDKIGLRFGLDAMLFGAGITQTTGLEDGATPSLKAIVLGAGMTYRLKAIDVLVNYDLNYMGIEFGAPSPTSMRMHTGTSVARTDIFHVFTVGAAKGF